MTEISASEFDREIRSAGKCLIHFWAEWNGYDVEQKRILQELESDFDDVGFYSIEVDPEENHQICADHGVQGPPTIVTYTDGIKQDTRVGFLQRDELIALLRCEEL